MSAIGTFNKAFRGGLKPKPARASIIPLDGHNEDAIMEGQKRSFQYFPETVSDSKGVDYQAKAIPGLSHPLYQWTRGDAREITFTSIFTRDNSSRPDTRTRTLEFETPDGDITGEANIDIAIADRRNADIPGAVAWLRSFLYPEYSEDGAGGFNRGRPRRPLPPKKLILRMPGMGLNLGVDELPPDEIYCIMTGCDVQYEAFFADGYPRIAKVDLTFAEIIQVKGEIKVHDASSKRNEALLRYTLGSDADKR